MPLRLNIYPPTNRDDVDIGLFTIVCYSAETTALFFSFIYSPQNIWHLAQVVSDSHGQEIGTVDPVDPGSEVTFIVEVTDSTDTVGENTEDNLVN